jgi:hypothetical protein
MPTDRGHAIDKPDGVAAGDAILTLTFDGEPVELVNCEQRPPRRSPPTDGEILDTLGDDGPPEP